MIRRHAAQTFGRGVADALSSRRAIGLVRLPALVTLWSHASKIAEGGEELETSWEEFFDVLRARRPYRGPVDQPGFMASVVSPRARVVGNVRAVSALALRFGPDDGAKLDDVATFFRRARGLVVTTNRHSLARHAFLVILPYERLASPAEHIRIASWAARTMQEARLPIDFGARNSARFLPLGGCIPGAPFAAIDLTGAPLDPGAVLAGDA